MVTLIRNGNTYTIFVIENDIIKYFKGTILESITPNYTEISKKDSPVFTGTINHNRKENSQIGVNSVSLGSNNISSGDFALAEGASTNAIGQGSHAEGITGEIKINGTEYQILSYGKEGTGSIGIAAHTEGINTYADVGSHAEGGGSKASGFFSHAEGAIGNISYNGRIYYIALKDGNYGATGMVSHTEGLSTLASGMFSHAEGYFCAALNRSSHAEGEQTIASGDFAHSEGYKTKSTNKGTHVEGYYTIAVGQGSHTEGVCCQTLNYDSSNNEYSIGIEDTSYSYGAKSVGSHVEGINGLATMPAAHAEGYKCTSSGMYSHAEGSETISSGTSSHTEGTKNIASGINSHAEGKGTNSVSIGSHTEGLYTRSSVKANYSHAEGIIGDIGTDSNGNYIISSENKDGDFGCTEIAAHSEGVNTLSSGVASHAEGVNTKAKAWASHAEGDNNIAEGIKSHAEGANTKASAEASHTEGFFTQATARASHAEGTRCTSSGDSSHTEGYNCSASFPYSHAEGAYCTALNQAAHAEGSSCTASGSASHAEGYGCRASGGNSHAQGSSCTASGNNSHAGGYGTLANAPNSTVIGSYNKELISDSATGDVFVIGNGVDSNTRSNALRVTFDGKVFALSNFNSTGADYAEYFEWSDGNKNEKDYVGHFVTLDGDKIKLANAPSDYVLGVVSGNPSVIGNSDEDWVKRYMRDDFGRLISSTVPQKYTELNPDTGKTVTKTKKISSFQTNSSYDSKQKYIPRCERKEWDAIGMLGVLAVKDDGTCKVNSYCQPTQGGIATAAGNNEFNFENGNMIKYYRVISRVSENVVKIVFR